MTNTLALTLVTEHDVVVVKGEDPVATFGRAPEASAQIGHAPTLDQAVSRINGDVFVARGHLMVANRHSSLAFSLSSEGERFVDVVPGASFGPPGNECEVAIHGALRHTIRIRLDRGTTDESGRERVSVLRTLIVMPELSERQRSLLDAYAEPMRNNSAIGLTHSQASKRLQISVSLVRLEINSIWDAFIRAGVPMRPQDTRIGEITDAWTTHHINGS